MTHSRKGVSVEITWNSLLISCLIVGWLTVGWFDSTAAGKINEIDSRGSRKKWADDEI